MRNFSYIFICRQIVNIYHRLLGVVHFPAHHWFLTAVAKVRDILHCIFGSDAEVLNATDGVNTSVEDTLVFAVEHLCDFHQALAAPTAEQTI